MIAVNAALTIGAGKRIIAREDRLCLENGKISKSGSKP